MMERLRFHNKVFLIIVVIAVALLAAVFISEKKPSESRSLRAMIVPHHDLVSPLIDDMFQQASEVANPELIVLIGPNHKNRGKGLSITTVSDLTTSLGPVHNASHLTQSLLDEQLAQEDLETLREEHSLTTLLPFVREYFAEAEVIPVVLQADFSFSSTQDLAQTLARVSEGKNVLFIASIDFSHYLPSEVAPQKDEVTKKAIQKRDLVEISRMNSDYLDSGPTLLTLLSFLEHYGPIEDELVHHTNSGIFIGERVESSTSYLMYRFWQDEEGLDK